jgi:hypothetical protein
MVRENRSNNLAASRRDLRGDTQQNEIHFDRFVTGVEG